MRQAGQLYLLDTNVAVWLDRALTRIPDGVLEILEDTQAKVYVSAVSFWELSIKQSAGKFDPDFRLEKVLAVYGLLELPITSKYADEVRGLPLLHRDPFDRMLVAQAIVEGMTLVTGDGRLASYAVSILRV